jgi:hypothetical protein
MHFNQFLVIIAKLLGEEDAQGLAQLLRPSGPQVKDLLNGLNDSRVS